MQQKSVLPLYYLYPSTIHADRNATQIHTILGSCISVCLYDNMKKIGGMNHYMLALWKGEGLATPKFGNIAIAKLVAQMEALGATRANLIAKVFGGAEQMENGLYNIGAQNIEVAKDMLKDFGIPIVSSCVGGNCGRRILFDTSSGLVFRKFVPRSIQHQ